MNHEEAKTDKLMAYDTLSCGVVKEKFKCKQTPYITSIKEKLDNNGKKVRTIIDTEQIQTNINSPQRPSKKDNSSLHSVMLIDGWKIYTPEDNESVIVIEDTFGHQREMDTSDFVKMLEVFHSVQDY